jgi:type I restriction enzyme M protein
MKQIFAGLPLEKSDHLLKIFEAIHNYIYANDGLSTQQTLEEFVKILFIKIFDEKSDNQQFFITVEEWDNLQEGKDNLSFLGRINQLFISSKQEYLDIFEATDRINLSSITLAFTVKKLQDISLSNSSDDSQGLAFQKIISHQEKDGGGQFFTPHPVIDLCVEILQPQPEETIMDPACGSGGFLSSALKYLTEKFTDINPSEIIGKHLFGLDINKSIARIAKMQLMLEYNTKPNIYCANALENLADLKSHNFLPDCFDIIFANPPFGATGKITNTEILSQYNLGYKWANLGDKFTN